MDTLEIKKHIDRVVGTKGNLSVPSWWMRKILNDIIEYCEEDKGISNSPAINPNSKIIFDFTKLGDPIETIDQVTRYSKEQFESAIEMSAPEFIEKVKSGATVELYLGPIIAIGHHYRYDPSAVDDSVLFVICYEVQLTLIGLFITKDFSLQVYTSDMLGDLVTQEELNNKVSDWNALEGENGYIKNKPISVTETLIEDYTLAGRSEYKLSTNGGTICFNHLVGGEIVNESREIESFTGEKFMSPNGVYDFALSNNNGDLHLTTPYAPTLILNKIQLKERYYNTLQEDFIPKTIARTQDVENAIEDLRSNIGGKTFVEITYAELVALRNSGTLTAGTYYRITDYETTTAQANTKSAGHPFDVIVEALDESTLSENASAIMREDDTYFETENLEAWQLKYCLDNDTERFAWAEDGSNLPKAEFVAMFWDDPENGINYDQHIGNDKIYDWGTESDPDTGMDNVVIYKSHVDIYREEGSADYNDKYFYRGVVEVDGEKYDSWKKFEDADGDWITNDNGQYQYALTERIVFDGQVIWPELEPEIIRIYDSSNCVIKGEYDDGIDDSGYNALSEYIEIAAIMMDDPVNGDPYETLDKDIFSHYEYETEPNGGNSLYLLGRFLEDDDDLGLCEDQKYYYRGVVSVNGSDFDCWQKCNINEGGYDLGDAETHKYYFLTNKIVEGDVTFTETEKTYGGKGVIYNMIDEYGNECPYDFKNIKFYHDGLGTDVYTFTWIDENYEVMDTSVFGNNGTLTCYGEIYGVCGNVIKPYMEIMYDEDTGDYLETKQSLNNITFISDYEYGGSGNEGFYGCYSNSFGNYCNSNSFGNGCNSNSFGNGCNSNSFGNDCRYNSFGNYCNSNSFGNGCYSNSFGNSCYSNSFGNGCCSNSFGNDCRYNSFGNYCYSNSFGNSCNSNSFGNGCRYNNFGNNCNSNSFGNDCYSNSFRLNASKTAVLLNYCYYNHFDDGCIYNVIWNSVQPTDSNKLQNINVIRGVSGTYSAYNFINIVDKNTAYEIKVAKNSSGAIKIYCEADLIK